MEREVGSDSGPCTSLRHSGGSGWVIYHQVHPCLPTVYLCNNPITRSVVHASPQMMVTALIGLFVCAMCLFVFSPTLIR